MRENKFKAWNRVTNQMSQPFTLEGIVTSSEIITCYRGIDGELEFLEHTGLKDKNSVGIYEGDIVRFKMGDIDDKGVIDWSDLNICFAINPNADNELYHSMHSSLEGAYEVIGNIYEELVKL